VGRFAVWALAEEARQRGFDRITAIWEAGEEGPEQFFLHTGFAVVGETQYGEKIGELGL
ncbi:MAG: GNAT family N-acetyltransferase, partial [Microbacteriaceae bacterium]|nr:GNAT family N-acetyltransferase [Microbacteriaceae bacterium]